MKMRFPSPQKSPKDRYYSNAAKKLKLDDSHGSEKRNPVVKAFESDSDDEGPKPGQKQDTPRKSAAAPILQEKHAKEDSNDSQGKASAGEEANKGETKEASK